MIDSIKSDLLGIAGIVTLIIVFVTALAKLRDELVNFGWLRADGFLGKMTARSQRSQIQRVLREMGFTSAHYQALRHAEDEMPNLDDSKTPWDVRLLSNLKHWTKELEPGYLFNKQRFYVDTMGAMDYVHDESTLARIFVGWVQELQTGTLPRVDLFLTPKDGNVALVRQVCRILSPSGVVKPIICKGARDHSRVVGANEASAHISDFEGLEPFLASDEFKSMPEGTILRVVASDDNCTSGATLCSVIQRFNSLVSEKKLPFQLVTQAVTLFVVKDEDTELMFKNTGVSLHALLSLGPEEMKRICGSKAEELVRDVKAFQSGFACETARKYSRHRANDY